MSTAPLTGDGSDASFSPVTEATKPAATWRHSMLLAGSGSLLVVLPAALRSASAEAPLWGCWMALWGAAALVAAPAAAALQLVKPSRGALASLLLGALLAAGPLTVFAQLIKRFTHHRPLGAVTFVLGALVVVLGGMAVAARLWSLAHAPGRWQRLWQAVTLGAVTLPGLWVALTVARTLSEPVVRSGLLDATLALALIALAALARPAALLRRVPAAAAIGLWIAAAGAAALVPRLSPAVGASVHHAGPVFMALGGWLGG